MFIADGGNGRAGAVAQHMNVGVGGKVAVGAEGDVVESCICLEGVVPKIEGGEGSSYIFGMVVW